MLRCGKPLPPRRWGRLLKRGLVAAVTLALISPSAMQVAWAQGGKVATAGEGTPLSSPLKLWYKESASAHGGSANDIWQKRTLPIGNGDMGANVYGEVATEHLTFNEKTLWTGGPSTSRPNYQGGNLDNKGNNGRRSRTSKSSSLRARTARLPTCATSLRARRMAMDRISRGAISTSRSTAFPIPAPPSTGARSISRTVSPTFPSNRAAPLISVSSLRATPIT